MLFGEENSKSNRQTFLLNKKYLTHFFGAVIIIGIALAFMFRGFYDYGMNYDEVYRANNCFPFFNENAYPYNQSICSIFIFNIEIPLMIKDYISYASLLPYLAIAWFKNPFFILRGLYYIYTLTAIVSIYFLCNKYHKKIAIITATLLTVNPFIYPEIRFGWSNYFYGIALVLVIKSWNKYYSSKKLRYLWACTFFLCFQVNIQFYFLWVATALVLAFFLLFPKVFINAVFHIKNLLVILSAAILGLLNYIIYNIQTGFPTFNVLWNYLFHLDTYNQNAIDGRKTESFKYALIAKAKSYLDCIEIWKEIFLCFLILFIIINFLLIGIFIYKKRFHQKRLYFLPGLVTILAFFLMIISPNSTGAHHLTYIVIPFTIWVSCILGMLIDVIRFRPAKYLLYGIICILTSVFFIQSNVGIKRANFTGGKGYFSNNIFDLIKYVDEQDEIMDENMYFLEWGLASQFYFMHSGEFKAIELFWGAYDLPKIQERISYYIPRTPQNTIYIPARYTEAVEAGDNILLFQNHNQMKYIKINAVGYLWIQELEARGGTYSVENIFDEKDGSTGIILIKVDNIDIIKQNMQ